MCWWTAAHLRWASSCLASCWPLTQIKLPQFAPSPPSLSFSLLPTARHFCFHMADFSGNTLIFVAFGVGSRVCCACQVFSLWLSPAPKLNCSVISCHPPLNHLSIPYLQIMSNFNCCVWRGKKKSHPVSFTFCVAHAECKKKVSLSNLDKKLTCSQCSLQ